MAALSAETALPSLARRGWIQSPGWDLFWMFSGLWGAAVLLVATWLQPLMAVVLVAFALERMFSVAHSWSTTYMVIGSPLLAEERRAGFWKYRVVPAVLAAVGLSLGLYVAAYQRYPADGSFGPELWGWGLYLALFWVGHFWHFGNQDFGVLTIYRNRSGQDRWIDRRVDKLYTATMMWVIQPIVYICLLRSTALSEMTLTALPLDPVLARHIATAAVGVAGLLTLGAVGFELSKPNRSLQKLLYTLVIFLHPTLLYGAFTAQRETVGLLYVIAYLWSHWLIAVGLVGRINSRYYRSRGDPPVQAVVRHLMVLGVIVGLVFLATQHYQEYALFNTSGFRYKQLLAEITPETRLAIGLVLGFFLAEQLVHYWCDRCLFRFRDPAIRRKVGALLLGDGPPARAT